MKTKPFNTADALIQELNKRSRNENRNMDIYELYG